MTNETKDIVLLIQDNRATTPSSSDSSTSSSSEDNCSLHYMLGTNLEVKPFPHPKRTDSGAQTLMLYLPVSGSLGGDIFELQSIQPRRHGSWFINQRVSSSPTFYMASKIDPRLLCLPFLESSNGKYSPLDQIVCYKDGCARIPLFLSNKWKMEEMCDVNDKLGDDMILYRHNEQKALSWLKSKVTRAAVVLASQRCKSAKRNNLTFVQNFNAGVSKGTVQSDSSEEHTEPIESLKQDTLLALELVAGYLTDRMSASLQDLLGFTADDMSVHAKDKKHARQKRKADWEEELEIEKETLAFAAPPSNNDTAVAPSAGTSAPAKKIASQTMKTSKANAAAAKGTKSMMSFFGKKK